MRVVFDLTGYELLVYAYIYNLVEVTAIELMTYTGIDKKNLNKALKELEDGGLILWRPVENEVGEVLPQERAV